MTMIRLLCAMLAMAATAHIGDAAAQTKPPIPLRVTTQPLTNYTPILVARDKGMFAEEGLSVSWTMVSQGALSIEAVYGGSAEFGVSGILEPMVARGNGLDIMLAVPQTRVRPEPPDNNGLIVRASDTIKTAKDLEGKTISAGLVNSINYIHMVRWLEKGGADTKKVRFIELPFPQMGDALFQNRVDAVWNVEPFVTIMTQTGNARVIAYPYLENVPGMDLVLYLAKESWLKANHDTAAGFRRGIEKATKYLNSAPKQERDEWVAKFTGVKPELVAIMNLPVFSTDFNVASLKANLDIAVSQKIVKPFDVETMIWKP